MTIEKQAKNLIKSALDHLTNENIFGIGKFNVILEKETVGQYKKTYYTIVENSNVLYDHLALFESAMAITKNLLNKNNNKEQQLIAEIDERYANALMEAGHQKTRIRKTTDKSTRSIYEAKYSEKLHKARTAKGEIKQLI